MINRWSKWTYTKPLATSGGIRSRTVRGRFYGSNWWSRRWIEILEAAIDSGRLNRGRSYARKGQVVDIEIEPGLVTASVQGTRKKPYQIRLGFETLSDEAKSLLLFRFREHSSFAAKLLAGEMPEEMENVFKEAGVNLFPNKSAIRRYKCSCPDEAAPCKHIIAVLLLLAEVFEGDPFLILKLRGIDRNALINLLTLETAGDREDSPMIQDEEREDIEDLSVITGGSECPEVDGCLENKDYDIIPLDMSWYGGEEMPVFCYAVDDKERRIAALEILNEFPFWRGEQPFRQSLRIYYERAANIAQEILTGEKRKTVGRPRKLI